MIFYDFVVSNFTESHYTDAMTGERILCDHEGRRVLHITPDAFERLREFNRTHPGVDISPSINRAIHNVLDDGERAEKG